MEDHPRALGWTPGPEDDRDFLLSNQLSEGACTSFSIGNAVNCEPRRSDIDSDFCFDAYHATTERDEFPGDWNTGQEGTSLRSAMQEWRRRRKISSFAFSYSVEEVVNWVLRPRAPVRGRLFDRSRLSRRVTPTSRSSSALRSRIRYPSLPVLYIFCSPPKPFAL
jgi:hypothetical protein